MFSFTSNDNICCTICYRLERNLLSFAMELMSFVSDLSVIEEMERLKDELEEEYKCHLEGNQREMEEMAKTFEERLKEVHMSGVSFQHCVLVMFCYCC